MPPQPDRGASLIRSLSLRPASRPSPFGKASEQKPKQVEKGKYTAGMTVEHGTFGIGIIRAVTPMAGDMLLQIEFSKVGLKKLMAGYAKLKIL